jgi:hypothetical protein
MNVASRPSLWPWVYIIAVVYFTLHLITSTRYGYFRDALYYLACSEHLAFGYVDQPPLIAVLGWFARRTLGTFATGATVLARARRRSTHRVNSRLRA